MTLNTTNSAKAPLVEMPIKSEEEDLLETNDFQETLIRYIEESGTPITIALQGEWGKGKTSMMNLVALRLCGKNFSITKSNAALPYHGVFINTWQFALSGGTPDQVTISILCSIINQLSELVPKEKSEKTKEALLNLAYNYGPEMLERIGSQLGKYSFISNIIAKALIFIRNNKNKASKDPQIKQLKDSIKKLIDEILEKDNIKKGIIFFIDDLDRITPELAVEILENFKNIFDFDHCIFVMAVDFNIIINGLKPKLGEYDDTNKKQFQLYFAKLVQISLPLPEPTDINYFIIETTVAAGLFTEEEVNKPNFRTSYLPKLATITNCSVGSNPRSMKQLVKKIQFVVEYEPDKRQINGNTIINNDDIAMKSLFFILTCLQTAYPAIYQDLSYDYDFKTKLETVKSVISIPNLIATKIEEIPDKFKEVTWLTDLYNSCKIDDFNKDHFLQLLNIFIIINRLSIHLRESYIILGSPLSRALEKTAILMGK